MTKMNITTYNDSDSNIVVKITALDLTAVKAAGTQFLSLKLNI
jgi:hypothetical protein